ncbi:MAG: LysR family transcriptional regulator [Betaproteobacteria bacterium]|nr:LysR family transcriptional regulator [Betaproteobacteria bacterium]
MSKADGGTAKAVLPLNSIRVFIEAARQLSFSRAALALGMTQSGVSHHVSSLENFLGQQLFVRSGSSVDLTDVGRLYFDTVQEAISTIELSTRQFAQRPENSGRLVVRTSLPTFAMTVLIPALPRFCPMPPVSVDVVTSLSPPAISDVYDVLITRDLVIDGGENWLLGTEVLVCVAAPSVHRQFAGKPIGAWPFLAAKSRLDTLPAWVNQQAIESHNIHVAATFDHYFLALPAAISGMGYLVIPHLLVIEPLRQGHLVEVDTPTVRSTASYMVYINPHSPVPEAAKTFCRWLKGQLRKDGMSLATLPACDPGDPSLSAWPVNKTGISI